MHIFVHRSQPYLFDIIDDDDSNRPMLWVDSRNPQSYEANFGVGGDGPTLPPTNSGHFGWDIVMFDSAIGKLYVNSPVPTHTAPAIKWDAGEEVFDFFNRDGKQAYRGLVAEVRVYNNLADFGGSYEGIYNQLKEKWMGNFRSPVVHLDASSLELESGDFVNQWGGLASEGQPKFLTDQTPPVSLYTSDAADE